MTELVEIEEKQALDYFLTKNGLDPVLGKIEQEIKQFVPDMTTQKGRDEIRSFAYKIRQSKTYIDGIGKKLVDELKEKPRLIDAERKRLEEQELRKSKAQERKKLEEEESTKLKEQQRILKEKEKENLKKEKEYLLKTFPIDDSWDEFKDLAKASLETTISYMDNIIDRAVEREEKEAELQRLKKEAAEREAKEREERIKKEAEEKARRDAEAEVQRKHEEEKRRLEEEKRQAELALKKEKEEKEKAIAEAKRKEEERIAHEKRKEQERIDAENRKKEHELAKKKEEERLEQERLANIAHRTSVEKKVAESLIATGHLSPEQSNKVINSIINGEIPYLEIKY